MTEAIEIPAYVAFPSLTVSFLDEGDDDVSVMSVDCHDDDDDCSLDAAYHRPLVRRPLHQPLHALPPSPLRPVHHQASHPIATPAAATPSSIPQEISPHDLRRMVSDIRRDSWGFADKCARSMHLSPSTAGSSLRDLLGSNTMSSAASSGLPSHPLMHRASQGSSRASTRSPLSAMTTGMCQDCDSPRSFPPLAFPTARKGDRPSGKKCEMQRLGWELGRVAPLPLTAVPSRGRRVGTMPSAA